jgi:hypothetical protein
MDHNAPFNFKTDKTNFHNTEQEATPTSYFSVP